MVLRALEETFAQAVVAQANDNPRLRNKRLRQLRHFRAYVVRKLEQGRMAEEALKVCIENKEALTMPFHRCQQQLEDAFAE